MKKKLSTIMIFALMVCAIGFSSINSYASSCDHEGWIGYSEWVNHGTKLCRNPLHAPYIDGYGNSHVCMVTKKTRYHVVKCKHCGDILSRDKKETKPFHNVEVKEADKTPD